MILDRVPAGRDIPNDFNVIIEIPAAGARSNTNWTRTLAPCSLTVHGHRHVLPGQLRLCAANPVGRWRSGGRAGGHPFPLQVGSGGAACRALGVLKMGRRIGHRRQAGGRAGGKTLPDVQDVQKLKTLPNWVARPDQPIL